MKFTSIIALLITATSLVVVDSVPTTTTDKVHTINLRKDSPPEYYTWKDTYGLQVNRALRKYSKNIKDAYAQGLVDEGAIHHLEKAFEPTAFESDPKSLAKTSKKGKCHTTKKGKGHTTKKGKGHKCNKGTGKKGKGSKGGKTGNKGKGNKEGGKIGNKGKGNKNGIFNNPLLDQGNDIGYHGLIKIGGQSFDVIFDTGSADLWVPSKSCKDQACKKHKSFNAAQSKNFKSKGAPFNIKYGTGSVSGTIATDDVSISGATAKRQTFGLTTSESNEFTNSQFDGILGMGLDQLSEENAPTPFSTLVQQKAVAKPQFAFLLGRAKDASDSQLTIGGVDTSKFTGSINFNKIVASQGFWEIALDDASVNGKSLGFKGKTAVIDTGTTLLIVPPDDAAVIHGAIDGSVQQQGQFFVPCDSTAVVALTFGGVSYKINAKDLAFQPINQNNLCVSGIAGENIGGPDQWLVGDTFLKNVYSVYDVGQKAVGFAMLK